MGERVKEGGGRRNGREGGVWGEERCTCVTGREGGTGMGRGGEEGGRGGRITSKTAVLDHARHKLNN